MYQKIVVAVFCIMGSFLVTYNAFARPVLLELYTSEGCSSCPAGEKTVAELNKRDDFFALSFHVDYWDRLGWKDKWAKPDFTKRQSTYMKAFSNNSIYTPQAVLDGKEEAIASWGWRVKMLAHNVRENQIDIPMHVKNGILNVEKHKLKSPADIWHITYNDKSVTDVKAGENRGRKLSSVNVVRTLQKLLVWNGERQNINLPTVKNAGERTAIIIQEAEQGKVLGLYHN